MKTYAVRQCSQSSSNPFVPVAKPKMAMMIGLHILENGADSIETVTPAIWYLKSRGEIQYVIKIKEA